MSICLCACSVAFGVRFLLHREPQRRHRGFFLHGVYYRYTEYYIVQLRVENEGLKIQPIQNNNIPTLSIFNFFTSFPRCISVALRVSFCYTEGHGEGTEVPQRGCVKTKKTNMNQRSAKLNTRILRISTDKKINLIYVESYICVHPNRFRVKKPRELYSPEFNKNI